LQVVHTPVRAPDRRSGGYSCHMRLGVVLALACGCFMHAPMHFGSGKSASEAQHQRATELTPPQLDTVPKQGGSVRTMKIRVWADDQYRAQNVRWQHSFEEPLGYANEVLASTLAIRLEPEYRTWDRHAPGATLAEDLDALAREDPGNDVFAVVGLTSALPLASNVADALGVARMPGHHLMLRGYADVYERKVLDASLPKLHSDEREALYAARRRHKTAAVLLHELGHNLGAPHEEDPDTIMNAMYSDRESSFSDRAREIMQRTLEMRGHPERRTAIAEVAAVKRPTLVLALAASGEIAADGKILDDTALGELLAATARADKETEVVVQIAPHVPHEAVIKLLDRAKAAGLSRMSISAGGP
jgi:hypothetical protein